MKTVWIPALLFAWLGCGSAIASDRPVTTFADTGDFTLTATPQRPDWRLKIDQRPADEWPEDHFLLRLYRRAPDSNPDIEFPFESTYGSFELTLYDLTGDGAEELVLITGQGRGTGVRRLLLRVFAVREKSLDQLLAMEVGDYFGFGCTWEYSRDYDTLYREDRSDHPPLLRLELQQDPVSRCNPGEWHRVGSIPQEKMVELVYDAKSSSMKPLRPPAQRPANP